MPDNPRPPYRDTQGHFISRERAIELGVIPSDEANEVGEEETPREWGAGARQEMVSIETGRGEAVSVPAGSPFRETVERLSDQANYGGFYRVFLNGSEVIEPEDAPAVIEPGMRIAITAYDKVG
jgi:hypothetical protein